MEKRRLILGIIAILAIALYIWIAYFEIPAKVKIGEDKLQAESSNVGIDAYLKGEVI